LKIKVASFIEGATEPAYPILKVAYFEATFQEVILEFLLWTFLKVASIWYTLPYPFFDFKSIII